MLLYLMAGLSALGQLTFTAEEARRLFDEKYQALKETMPEDMNSFDKLI